MNEQRKEDLIKALTILDEKFEGLSKEERDKKLAGILLLSVEELAIKGFWGRACARLARRNELLMKVLEQIANEDFRGNRSSGSIIAYNALRKIKEGQEDF